MLAYSTVRNCCFILLYSIAGLFYCTPLLVLRPAGTRDFGFGLLLAKYTHISQFLVVFQLGYPHYPPPPIHTHTHARADCSIAHMGSPVGRENGGIGQRGAVPGDHSSIFFSITRWVFLGKQTVLTHDITPDQSKGLWRGNTITFAGKCTGQP